MKRTLRKVGLFVGRFLGTRITDEETGEPLGRIFAFSWRGQIHVIGLNSAVRPVFLAQERLTYWKQELGFAKHSSPDFASLPATRLDNKIEPPLPVTLRALATQSDQKEAR